MSRTGSNSVACGRLGMLASASGGSRRKRVDVGQALCAHRGSGSRPRDRSAALQQRLDLRADLLVGVADPGHVRLDVERRVERPARGSVTMTPASRAISSVDRSYGWQQMPRRSPRAARLRLHQRPQVGDEPVVARPSARRAARRCRCTGPRSSAPCPRARARARRARSPRRSRPAPRARPGRSARSCAKPCAMVGAPRRPQRERRRDSPVSRSNRSRLHALALHRPERVARGAA